MDYELIFDDNYMLICGLYGFCHDNYILIYGFLKLIKEYETIYYLFT